MSKQISRASIPSQPVFFFSLRLFVSRVGGKKKSKFLPLNWVLHSSGMKLGLRGQEHRPLESIGFYIGQVMCF